MKIIKKIKLNKQYVMKLREKVITISKNRDSNRIYNSKYYIKMIKQINISKKLSSFYRNIRNLIYCLYNNKNKNLIINCNERIIQPEYLNVNIKPWEDILKNVNGQDLIKFINEDEIIKKQIKQLFRYMCDKGKKRWTYWNI